MNLVTLAHQKMHSLHVDMVKTVLEYVKRILTIFGVLQQEVAQQADSSEELANVFAAYRASVRQAAKSKEDFSTFFKLSDLVRDQLGEIGYIIDDHGDESVIRKNLDQ